MRYLFMFLLVGLMVSCGDASGDVTKEKQAKSTVKIGDLEVMTEDLGEMSWEDAKKACADLGVGWRWNSFKIYYIIIMKGSKK